MRDKETKRYGRRRHADGRGFAVVQKQRAYSGTFTVAASPRGLPDSTTSLPHTHISTSKECKRTDESEAPATPETRTGPAHLGSMRRPQRARASRSSRRRGADRWQAHQRASQGSFTRAHLGSMRRPQRPAARLPEARISFAPRTLRSRAQPGLLHQGALGQPAATATASSTPSRSAHQLRAAHADVAGASDWRRRRASPAGRSRAAPPRGPAGGGAQRRRHKARL